MPIAGTEEDLSSRGLASIFDPIFADALQLLSLKDSKAKKAKNIAVLRLKEGNPTVWVWTMAVGRATVSRSTSIATTSPSSVTTPFVTSAPTPAVSATAVSSSLDKIFSKE
jgi:hypothetical protein